MCTNEIKGLINGFVAKWMDQAFTGTGRPRRFYVPPPRDRSNQIQKQTLHIFK